ncbi:MAG: aminotransferase class I/II-fold pyridoxal phosphate-dependent enzyme, partial [Candidatus Aenigmarchaeota archaeon]|nr:aminotransferase class I/II-fold pyridoxal phosphate-dependent enzyme [Candidatus Aenigmarchaeota archaeon]
MESPFAKRMACVTSPIRELVATAKQLEKSGKHVLYANTGDPLRYDFDPPPSVVKGLMKAVKNRHNYYADSQGELDCREAISKREKRVNNIHVDPNNIIITDGVSEALSFLTSILIESQSEALLPGPSYPPYITRIEFFDGRCNFYKTIEEDGWQPSVENIEKKITDKTKFLLVINPNNPTGAVYSKKTLKEIINLAGQHNLTLVSDEIYDLLTFDARLVSISSLCK